MPRGQSLRWFQVSSSWHFRFTITPKKIDGGQILAHDFRDFNLWTLSPWLIGFLQSGSTFHRCHHRPVAHYAAIGTLSNWWGQNLHGPVTLQTPHLNVTATILHNRDFSAVCQLSSWHHHGACSPSLTESQLCGMWLWLSESHSDLVRGWIRGASVEAPRPNRKLMHNASGQ